MVEEILDGRQPPTLQLDQLFSPLPVTSNERKLVAAMLADGQEVDSNILLFPVRRTRILTEGVAVRRAAPAW